MKLYEELAPWWPLLSPPGDYAVEAGVVHALLTDALGREPATLLELGSGGGHLASHFPDGIDLTLVDLAPGMLAASRALNPHREHIEADMRSLRLGRRFDAVLLFDAVMYLTTEAELSAAFATAAAHLDNGGAFLVVPDAVTDSWQEGVTCGGGEAADGRAAQMLEWQWDPDPTDTTTRVDFAFLLRDTNGTVRCVHDEHTMGLFPRATWWRLLREAGFEPVELDPRALEHLNEPFLTRRSG